MKIKAVILDMDGTLLGSNHKPSERTTNFLKSLEDKGVKVIIATGRSFPGAEHVIKKMGLKSEYLICYNGAKIVKYADKSTVYENCLADETVRELIKVADTKKVHINLYQDGNWYVDDEGSKETNFYSEKCGITPVIREHNSFENYEMPKIIYIGENSKIVEVREEIERKLGDKIGASFSSDIFLEVMNKGVNKGNTVKWFLDHLGIDRNECAAFGDAENDLEMLLSVKYGVAMGNANDELKSKLNYSTLSNDEDGIVAFLEGNID